MFPSDLAQRQGVASTDGVIEVHVTGNVCCVHATYSWHLLPVYRKSSAPALLTQPLPV